MLVRNNPPAWPLKLREFQTLRVSSPKLCTIRLGFVTYRSIEAQVEIESTF